jgi:hypothetical protein
MFSVVIYQMFRVVIILIVFLGQFSVVIAGPPFLTDDPEPVDFKHWEFYISTINVLEPDNFSGTLPHFETNYGIFPNTQVHLLLPLNYTFQTHQKLSFGYAYTEFGIKYRFIKETENFPQIGTFPIIEIPTIQNNQFSNNKFQLYIPVWIQKSWDKITTYGGCGYWFNPGTNNKNWIFAGWLLQYDFSKKITLGGELFYHSAASNDDSPLLGFNVGGFLNITNKSHFIISAGHNFFSSGNIFMFYAGFLWTI